MTDSKDKDPIFEQLEQIVDGLAQTFAPFCEVVLHDLTQPENAIWMIKNPLSQRKAGEPATELGMARIANREYPQVIANYANSFSDGRRVKSTSIGIKNANGDYIAALCLNVDMTIFNSLQGVIAQFSNTVPQGIEESLSPMGPDAIRALIEEYAARNATTPRSLKAEQRRELLSELKKSGCLEIRRAQEIIGAHLGVSRATIYSDVRTLSA